MSSVIMIERYGIPTKLDSFPYGTACKVIDHHYDHYDLYLQIGEDEDDPKWEYFEKFNVPSDDMIVTEMILSRLRKNFQYD